MFFIFGKVVPCKEKKKTKFGKKVFFSGETLDNQHLFFLTPSTRGMVCQIFGERDINMKGILLGYDIIQLIIHLF